MFIGRYPCTKNYNQMKDLKVSFVRLLLLKLCKLEFYVTLKMLHHFAHTSLWHTVFSYLLARDAHKTTT